MGAVAAVADEDEGTVREPAQDEAQQPLYLLGRGVVAAVLVAVEFGRAAQGDEDGQRPRAGGEGEADQDRQGDPLVAVAEGGVRVAGADRVTVSGLAVNLAAPVLTDGIVADEGDGPGRDQMPQEEARQQAGKVKAGPAG